MMSINTKYVQERVHRYNERPSDDLLYQIGSHADLIEGGDGRLTPKQRFQILEWLLCEGYAIERDLALLIFGKEQLVRWLEISRRAYPSFIFYLTFEFQEKEHTGWEEEINFTLFWHPMPGAPMPEADRDFPWRLDWESGALFWGDGTVNDFEFTLSVYPNQQSFTNPDWICEKDDRYCSFTDDESDLMTVAEVLEYFPS